MRKNKITILLVACVLMLTVYYLNIPSNSNYNEPVNNTQNNEPVGTTSYYISFREEISTSRTVMFEQLNLILGNDASSIEDKELALNTMSDMTTLQEKELMLEKMIKNLGYDDCLVYANDKTIKINILSEEFTVDQYIEVAVMAKSHFDRSYTVNIEVNTKN